MKALARQVLPSFVWERLKRVKADVLSPNNIQSFLERAGYVVARKTDYYSPLTSVSELKSNVDRWYRPSALKGVEYDLNQMKAALSDLLSCYLQEFMTFPPYEQLQQVGFGPGYTAVDALTLYMMIRQLKPKRYVEVGSGLSTYYCSLAAARNAIEGHPLAITCIEPYPFKKLHEIPGIEVIAKPVQDVERIAVPAVAQRRRSVHRFESYSEDRWRRSAPLSRGAADALCGRSCPHSRCTVSLQRPLPATAMGVWPGMAHVVE